MHNYKFWCPRCLKTWKGKRNCCNRKTICIGTRWRMPSYKASKKKWKENLSQLQWRDQFDPDVEKVYNKLNIKYKVFERSDLVGSVC